MNLLLHIGSWMTQLKKPVHFVGILQTGMWGPGRGATRWTQQHDGITATEKVIVVSSAVDVYMYVLTYVCNVSKLYNGIQDSIKVGALLHDIYNQ